MAESFCEEEEEVGEELPEEEVVEAPSAKTLRP